MAHLLAAARAAFDDEDFDESLQILDDAMCEIERAEPSPQRDALVVKLLGQRSETLMKCGLAQEALDDAARALSMDADDVEALLRSGVAMMSLDDAPGAVAALERATALEASGTSRRATCARWLERARAKVAESSGARSSDSVGCGSDAKASERYKRTWYQSDTHATVEVFARGVAADSVTVDLSENGDDLRLTIDALTDDDGSARTYDPYVLNLRLYAPVHCDGGSVSISPAKVEIRMRKRVPGQWRDLEQRDAGGLAHSVTVAHVLPTNPPTSAPRDKRSAKDWDALERELADELADEKQEGDAALNELFQKIYANADDDTRRAMNKSFIESNGTVLSTDWTDVGSRDVAPEAP